MGLMKKFLDSERIETAIDDVLALAQQQEVPIALVGGVAMQLYGSDRLTMDVDFIAPQMIDGISIHKPLSFGGYSGQIANGVPVDIIVRDDEYADLYREALECAVFESELNVLIVLPSYLAAMKMAAGRSGKDADLYHLIVSGALVPSMKETRDIIKRHLGRYAATEFDALVEEALWRASKGK